jgi:putative oxidoreductase
MRLAFTLGRLAFAPLPAPPGFFALPLRLIVGYGFLEHGYAKLARGPDDFIAILHAIGVPFAFFPGWATIAIEVVGGLLILCGAFVPLASAPMIVVLLVAIFTVHLPNGFSSIKLIAYDASGAHFGPPGYETDLLYLAALLALCFGGAGPLSFDGYMSARPNVDRRDAAEPAFAVMPPESPVARRPSSPSPPPSERRRAPPTANRR